MELRDIEYFAVVAEHGHLGRAAETLGLSTPALSKSLRRLELALHAKLVKRTPKGVELTAEGSALLAHVRPLRVSLQDIGREIAGISEGRSGHLRFGAVTGAMDHLLPAAFGALFREAPDVRVSVSLEPGIVTVPALRGGQLDLVVMNLPPTPYEDIVQEPLYQDDFVVYASAAHRLVSLPRVEIADLAAERWAFPTSNGISYRWMHRVFEDQGLPPPRVSLVGGPLQMRLNAVGTSGLLGLAPRRIVRQVAPHLNLAEIRLEGPLWTRRVGLGYRKDGYLSPVARRFIEILKETAKDTAV